VLDVKNNNMKKIILLISILYSVIGVSQSTLIPKYDASGKQNGWGNADTLNKDFAVGSGLSGITTKEYYTNITDTTSSRKIGNGVYELLEIVSYTPPKDTTIGSNLYKVTKNTIWKNSSIVSGKTVDFVYSNTGIWKKATGWSTSDWGIKADGTDRTAEFQIMLNYFNRNSTAYEVQVDSGVRFNLCNLTTFPKHIQLNYYANSDLCRNSLYSGQVLTERKTLVTGGSDTGFGVVNEQILESPFNPGLVLAVNPSIGGYEQHLTGSQTMRSPARTTLLSSIDKIDAWNLNSERQDTSMIRGTVAINGVNFNTYNFKLTLNGVGTSNTTGLVIGDIVIGVTSKAVGLVYDVTTTTTSVCWRFGAFQVGEKIRITTTTIESSGTITSLGSVINEATITWSADEVKGSLNVWALPYNNNTHRFTIGKGVMIAAAYDGSRTGMFNGEAANDRYIGFRNSYSSAATGKYVYWDDSKDALDIRNKELEKIASFTNANDFLVGDSAKSANFGGRIIQLGNTSDNITTIGSRSVWGDWGWNNYSNLYYLQRNSNAIIPLKIADNKIGIGGTLVAPAFMLDIDAKTASTGNPIRAKGLLGVSSVDSLIGIKTAEEGVFKSISVTQVNDVAYTTVMPQLEFKATSAVTTTGTTSITLTKIAGSPDIPTGCDFSRMQLYFKGLKQIRDIGVSTRDFKITSATSTTVTIDFYTTATTKEIAINDYFTIDVVR